MTHANAAATVAPEPNPPPDTPTATMKPLILAPLRGFTDAVFRNAFQHHFRGVDHAVAPFVTSLNGRHVTLSHLRDLAPADNQAMPVVPQILSNSVSGFVALAKALVDLGYGEINWNLGCPYPMVAKKMRGSGLLPHPDQIDRILEQALPQVSARVSVKTRLGRFAAEEMTHLIPVFNRYPLARVIIHPRTGVQMYGGTVDLETFQTCLAHISHPVCYNGDIHDRAGFRQLQSRFPGVSGWMLGRGLLANPFLCEMIQHDTPCIDNGPARFAGFHDDLVAAYLDRFSGPGHVLDRMKGFWGYFAAGLVNGARILKKIRKAGSLDRYRHEVAAFLGDEAQWVDPAVPSERV